VSADMSMSRQFRLLGSMATGPILGSFRLMRVTLFGTRGSLAAPGAETTRYGGNTSTVEVCANDGTLLVLDAGTGIRRLAKQIPLAIPRIDILLTHLHMDHIQGLGFFGPLYDPGVDVHIWGPASSMLRLEARLSRYLSPPLFPVHLRDLPKVVCHEVPRPPFEIGPFRIRTALFVTQVPLWAIVSRQLGPQWRIFPTMSLPLAYRTVGGLPRIGFLVMIWLSMPIC
jgi:Beta-lactamase superfamily domain